MSAHTSFPDPMYVTRHLSLPITPRCACVHAINLQRKYIHLILIGGIEGSHISLRKLPSEPNKQRLGRNLRRPQTHLLDPSLPLLAIHDVPHERIVRLSG